MFIREVHYKKNGKSYSYLRLVKNVRTDKGVKQIIIANLSNMRIPKSQYKPLAKCIESILKGETFFEQIYPKQVIKKAKMIAKKVEIEELELKKREEIKKEGVKIELNSVKAKKARQIGVEYVVYSFWKRLGFEEILKDIGFTEKQIKLAGIEIISKLIEPESEKGTAEWAKRSGIVELLGIRPEAINETQLYRVSDKLLKYKDKIEESLVERERCLFNLEEGIILYDLTSTYFEGVMEKNEEAEYGYSKDKRKDCKQIVIGLVMDERGFVKSHTIYKGNKVESETLEEIIEELEERYGKKVKRIVMDKGIATKRNVELLKERGYKYIIAVRGKEKEGLKERFKIEEIEGLEVKEGVVIKKEEIGDESYLFCQSEARRRKEEGIRKRFMARMEEGLNRLKERVAKGRLKGDKLKEAVGRLKEKNKRVWRYYEIKYEDGINWRIREDKLKEAIEDEGKYIIKTNEKDISEEEMWKIYMMLSRVEDGFKSLKSELKIRPIIVPNDLLRKSPFG